MSHQHLGLASQYEPGHFGGDLLLFTATADRTGEEPPPEAWHPYMTGEMRTHEIPCRHQLMTEPSSLGAIGTILSAELNRNS